MTTQTGTSKEEVVQLVMKHERLLTMLYEVFEHRFPEHQFMWERLIQDHQAHVTVLDELLKYSNSNNGLTLDNSAFHSSTIMYSVEYVAGQILKSLTDETVDSAVALGLCNSLENSGLAQRFYGMFQPLSHDEAMKSEFHALEDHVHSRNEVLQNYTKSWKQVA